MTIPVVHADSWLTCSRRSVTRSWRVRRRPAGPAGYRTACFGPGVTVRIDAADPDVVLDTELTDITQFSAWAELVSILFGADVVRVLGLLDEDDELHSAGGSESTQTAADLRRLVAMAAASSTLPELAAADVAHEADALSARILAMDGTKNLAALLHRFAVMEAARASYSIRSDPDYRDFLGSLSGVGAAAFSDVAITLESLIGGLADVLPQLAEPSGVRWETWDPTIDLPRVEEPALRGRGRRRDEGTEVEVLASDLAVQLIDVIIVSGTRAVQTVSGSIEPVDRTMAASDAWRRPLPRLWVRAISVDTGLLLYEAECSFGPDGFRAELVAVGAYPNDFWLDFTHDLRWPPRGESESRQVLARRLGARAAGLQEIAKSRTDWVAVARMWEQSAKLWRFAGDPARRALSLVHAVRAWRAAGSSHDADLHLVQGETDAALDRLDPRWEPPNPTTPAITDPLALDVLWRTAALTPHLTAWVIRTIDALADELRTSPAGDRARVLRRVDDLTRLGGSENSVLEARARARVALALWAARVGRRRLAHSILLPIAIDFTRLDERGRNELAEANRLLASIPEVDDPDEADRTEDG